MFVKQNDAFANRYMDEFIGKYIQDQMIPDILTEVMDELDHEVNIINKNKKIKV